ncbi:MAG: GNAT family N-acetyltransferase [Burkholderiales bacterium]|nr:GNAT family N-acetyltransferase [Burkholderiales bacterium]
MKRAGHAGETGNREAGFAPVRVALRDGRSVMVRAIRPDDADAMRAALDDLSPEARYSRFMMPLKQLSPVLLERAVRVAGERERALVAVIGESPAETVVGGARYAGGPDDEACEFAITVADGWRGAGLASRMLKVLIADARARGWRRMEGYVLASNRAMLDLARRLGFEVGASEEGPSVKLVRLDLVRAGEDD